MYCVQERRESLRTQNTHFTSRSLSYTEWSKTAGFRVVVSRSDILFFSFFFRADILELNILSIMYSNISVHILMSRVLQGPSFSGNSNKNVLNVSTFIDADSTSLCSYLCQQTSG